MIGSARKWSETRRSLEAEGFASERLAAIRCPIGLAIGSRTPAEIAVAIAAEIIKERRPS
jgi:xanthine dehydrogenase accessory factor